MKWDTSWIEKITAKHKVVFDSPQINDGDALYMAAAYFDWVKDVFKAGAQADGHGFDYIDPAQEAASKGAAGYYSWSPTPGMRFIALDTVAEAGTIVTPTGHFTAFPTPGPPFPPQSPLTLLR